MRAWRSYSRFEGRSSVRTWLYQIATNATLSALEHHSRRVLPSGLGAPSDDPSGDATPAAQGFRWLEPIPDALIAPESDDPATITVARAGLRLALIASLQQLPARQRAVLILRDVLSFRAYEVAAMLGTSTAAVKSAPARARAALEHAGADELTEPGEPRARSLLDQYVAAFERSDMSLLERALRDDAALEMTGSTTWFAGKRTCVPYIRRFLLTPGDWRMVRPSRTVSPPSWPTNSTETGCTCRSRSQSSPSVRRASDGSRCSATPPWSNASLQTSSPRRARGGRERGRRPPREMERRPLRGPRAAEPRGKRFRAAATSRRSGHAIP